MRRGLRQSLSANLPDGHGSQKKTGPEAANIEIYIEELVLDGFNLSDGYAIGDALSRELEVLIREQATLHFLSPLLRGETQAGGDLDLDRLNAGSITLKPGSPAAAVGGQVARAVHGILRTVENNGNGQNGSGRSSPGRATKVAPTGTS
jgi:hypothetical protein